jgi:lipid-A-disaccharide synthase-like uncharacterized protein
VRELLRISRFFIVLGWGTFGGMAAASASAESRSLWDRQGQPWEEVEASWETVALLRVNLPGARNQVELVRQLDGSEFAYRIRRLGEDQDRLLTAAEFHEVLERERPGLFWLWRFFNISGFGGLLWVGLGLLGQVLFAGRMVVQWITSEKEKRSVVPVAFWWMSLVGASMLLVYFLWRRDVIGVLGQGMGWMIYVRNLWLIYGSPASSSSDAPGSKEPSGA